MRYAYFKSGYIVDEIRRVISGVDLEINGPDVFVADLIAKHPDDELLMLGRDQPRATVVWKNVRVECYPTMDATGFKRRPLKRVWSALRIGFAMWRWRPDRIVCGTMGEVLWVSVAVAKTLGASIVFACHTQVTHRSRVGSSLISRLDNVCIRSCDAVVCHGPFLKDQIRALGVAERNIYEFDIDLREFATIRAEQPMPEQLRSFVGRFDIAAVFIGRMQREKGIFDLLDAVHGLPPAIRSKVGLVYVGDGGDASDLAERVRELGVSDGVFCAGRRPHPQLPAIIAAAAVVVAPTRPECFEGRCMVVLEALVLGVPVIAPDFGPFPYAIDDGVDGLLFEPGESAALAACLERIAREDGLLEALRRGARAKAAKLVATGRSFGTAIDSAFAAGAANFA
jgi:glycosyltransferase involved in cell wall biosynthesis